MTRKQKQAYDYIRQYIEENDGISPSYEEIKDALGLKSKSGIYRIVYGLSEKGMITVLRNRARSISLVKHCHVCGAVQR